MKKILFIVSILLSAVGSAHANLSTYTSSLTTYSGGTFDTNFNWIPTNEGSLVLSQFNSNLGTLNKVTLTVSDSIGYGPISMANTNSTLRNFKLLLNQTLSIVDGTTTLLFDTNSVPLTSWSLPANSSLTVAAFSKSGNPNSADITGSALSRFIGQGNVGFDVIASQYSEKTVPNQSSMLFDNVITANAIITYDYTPTPIPAAAWLLGSGLLGLVGMRRKKQ
jgi:hypothetical protein